MPEPRWTLELHPEGSESLYTVKAHADDVTYGEVAFHMAKALVQMTASPNYRMPTVEEVQAEAARRQLRKDHPGTYLYTRAGRGVFLGETARTLGVGQRLEAAGWSEVLVIAPEKVTEPCAYQSLGDDAFTETYLGADPPTADA